MSPPATNPAATGLDRSAAASSPAAALGDEGSEHSQKDDKVDNSTSQVDAEATTDPSPTKTQPMDGEKTAAPPLPNEPTPSDPPLPDEAVPSSGGEPPLPQEPPPRETEDDGWDFQWDPTTQAYFFYNRFTGKSQWENPRLPGDTSTTTAPGVVPGTTAASGLAPGPAPPTSERPAAGGYNPAIHGDYDPNAWYAQGDANNTTEGTEFLAGDDAAAEAAYSSTGGFNRFTGQFQSEDMGPGRHTDEAKSRRQMNAFFDVDAAANAHDGRSLKAERSNKKPSRSELKAFKEKRKARKEEKRRAWLRD